MTPERLQKIEKIFREALDQEPDQVGAFLDMECQDDVELRRKIEALLSSREKAYSFIEKPAAGLASKIMQDRPDHPLVGEKIGRYKIVDPLGSGGMGDVYLATDVIAGRKAALKVLPFRFTGDPERLKRFQQEARAVVGLNHPNILTVYEIGEDQSVHYIASELIEGETLRQRLTRGPIQLSDALDVAIQVTSALAAAHQAGTIHRDIKPENIMVRPDGYVKVLDFGIAKLAEQELPLTIPRDEALLLVETNLGSILGTVRYMSPEQACGGRIDKTTDIWSVGVVLYEMLTGKAPFSGETPAAVMSSILEQQPVPIAKYVAQAPAELNEIITKTLRKDRNQRYQSAPDLLEALKQLRRRLEFEAELQRSTVAGEAELEIAAEAAKHMALEIGHVLFVDIVGYSQLSINEQHAAIAELTQIVRSTEQFQKAETADRLIKLATGDGMALVFYTTPDAPVRCAMEISRALKQNARLRVRMGVHSGPVSSVTDVTGRTNLAGAGLNLAQRVMDCGDAGHILVSKHVADDLGEFQEWRPLLHDLGTYEVKHGVRIHIVNIWSDEVGNRETPQKFRALLKRTRVRWVQAAAALMLLAAIAVAFIFFLRKPATGKVLEKGVAVLPFENLGADQENAVFAGGVHREILLNLAKIGDLKVISRTSVMQYAAGTARNLKQIARELGVAHVVEGSVQRSGNKVRVTAQLIDAATDTQMWSQAYDRELADVFAIQSEVAEKISNQLGAKLTPQERSALATAPPRNVEAFDLYTKARTLMETGPDNLDYAEDYIKAVDFLEASLKLDPQFVVGYCALAEANTQLYREGHRKDCAPAQAALKEARRIAPDAGEVHFAQALIQYYCDLDFNRALATLELAARSLPNNAEIFTLRGLLERRFGRWEEALRHFKQAIELNPKDSTPYGHAAGSAWALRRYDESRRIMDAAIAAFPAQADDYRYWKVSLTQFVYGDVKGARQELTNIRTKDSRAYLDASLDLSFFERNYAETERVLAAILANGKLHRIDYAWAEAGLAIATNGAEEKREAWAPILATAAEEMAREPSRDNSPQIKAIAFLNAALGNKQEAISMAKRGVEHVPVSRDALVGPDMLLTLATVCAWTGEKDLAFETLFALAKMPHGQVYVGDLKLNPFWDNLRNDPRFPQLLAEAAKPLK